MSGCNQCGECCRWMIVARKRGLKPNGIAYLRDRCDKETKEYFLIDSPCKHLKNVWIPDEGYEWETEGAPINKHGKIGYACRIYETRPLLCKEFRGERFSGGNVFYVPETCSLAGFRILPTDQSNSE